MKAVLRDGVFWTAILIAPFGCLLFDLIFSIPVILGLPKMMGWYQLFMLIILFPVIEEVAFRGTIQSYMTSVLPKTSSVITSSNIVTSILFVMMHLIPYRWEQALTLMLPSLLFGYFKDRYHILYPSISLHIWFNLCFYMIIAR